MEIILDANNFFQYQDEYRRIAYAAMIRGIDIKMVTHPSMIEKSPEMMRAGLVSLMSVKYKRIFSEPMLISMILAPTCQKIIDEIGNKTPEELGLKEVYSVQLTRSYVEVSELPSVKYLSHTLVEVSSEKKAYNLYMSGRTALNDWGSVVTVTKIPVEETLCEDDDVPNGIEHNVIEEGQLVEQLVDSSGDESAGFFVAPPAAQVISGTGDIGHITASVEFKSPGRDLVSYDYLDDGEIIPFFYNYICTIVYKYKVIFINRYTARPFEDAKLLRLDKMMRSEILSMCSRAYHIICKNRLRLQGTSRFTRTMITLIKTMKFPTSMPLFYFVSQLASIACGTPSVWHEYKIYMVDWRIMIADIYNPKKTVVDIARLNFLSPMRGVIPGCMVRIWNFEGTYEEFEDYLKEHPDTSSFVYDDNGSSVEQREGNVLPPPDI